MLQLTLYGKPGCHLCDEAEVSVAEAIAQAGVDAEVTQVDITSDPVLQHRFGEEIPVLTLGERKLAQWRVDAPALAALLREC